MNTLQLRLTKLYLRYNYGVESRNGFITVTLPNGDVHQVIVIKGKPLSFLRQLIVCGTIVIHEVVFQSDSLLEYVTAHEAAHKRQWYRHLVIPLFLVPLFLVFPVFSFTSMKFLALLIPLIVFVWFVEFKADYEAIKVLGVGTVQQALDDIKALVTPSAWVRIKSRFLRLPTKYVIRVYYFFHPDLKG